MWRFPVRWIRLAILLIPLLCWGKGNVLFAQELSFGGVGPINHSLAGAAVALPRDSAGAMQWNPATVSFLELELCEFQLGMGRHNAPWYGDEFVVGTFGVGVVVIAWLYLVSTSDNNKDDVWTWERRQERTTTTVTISPVVIYPSGPNYYVRPPQQNPPSAQATRTPRPTPMRVPTLSYVYRPQDSDWSFGLAISEWGSRKVGAMAIGEIVGIGEYQFKGYEFIPTVSLRTGRQFSLGVSPIFSIEQMPNASLPVIVAPGGLLTQDQRSKAGFGVQAGMYYAPSRLLRFGASVRTPLLISKYTYRWIDPITGELGTQRFSFSQDSAFRIALGTSFTLPNNMTTFAADFRYSDYSHASALYDIPASFDPAVKKQGVSRAAYSIALGAEHRPWDIIAFRMGYQWNHAVTPERAIIYNTTLPVHSGHSIHYGVTFFFSEHFDLSFSSSNAVVRGRETIHTESGPISFRRNPNRSNFWAAARIRF
jgi:long-subunit fatty acid transport protein